MAIASANPFALEDHTILITGGASGIGASTAAACAALGANESQFMFRDDDRCASSKTKIVGRLHRPAGKKRCCVGVRRRKKLFSSSPR
jgi:NADP-dependent 3-hydroxy acid dehydrogenase YdfG